MNNLYNHLTAVSSIVEDISEKDIAVSSAGYPSRALYNVKDRDRNFYMMGSLGAALGFAIGIALNRTEKVIAILGDGEALNSLNTFVLVEWLRRRGYLDNLEIHILDSNSYLSTGGQHTCSDAIDFSSITKCKRWKIEKKEDIPRVGIEHIDIKRRFYEAINSS